MNRLVTSCAVAWLGVAMAWPATRQAPRETVILESATLKATLDRADGLPYRYELGTANLWGEDAGANITAIVCRLQPRGYETVSVKPVSVQATGTRAEFLFKTRFQGAPAASFSVVYSLEGTAILITLEHVSERPGFELIEVSLPNLATVREEDGAPWLAHGRDGGAVVDLRQARTAQAPEDEVFGNIAHVLPVAMIGTAKAECAMEVSAFMDGLEMEIAGEHGRRHARIGTVQRWRVHGGRSYEMNDGGPKIAGNENTPNLIVGQTPRCRLDFMGDVDGNGTVDWLDGVRVIAARMPDIPTHYFDDKLLYMIAGKYKPESAPRTTFAQSEKLIRDISMLTDNAPQVPLVSGWVYDGQDTGFPSEDKVNDSVGGYEKLMHLMREGRKHNANVSVNVNYDDAYRSSPIFDESFLARRPDGKPWVSRDWAGDVSYIVGMAKYVKQWGPARMDFAVSRYGLHDAMLIDALSWYSIRNDWDPAHPASGYKNLVEGRYRVIEGFRDRGVNVVSEQLRYAMLGKLALSVDGVAGGRCPFGGEPIPLLPALYRKSAIWGGGGRPIEDVQNNLFWNCRPGPWYSNATDRNAIADFYYMTVLPFNRVHDRAMTSYDRRGFLSTIGLGPGSKIEVDWMTRDYSVVVQGVEIAGREATFCPIDENRIAFYSRKAARLTAPVPAGWNEKAIAARALYVDHREAVPVKVEHGSIVVEAAPKIPVVVYRNDALADQQR